MSDFESPNSLATEWQEVIGGEIVKPEEGCGIISSGSSLYFHKVSVYTYLMYIWFSLIKKINITKR